MRKYWFYLRNLYLEKMYSGHPMCDLIAVSVGLLSNPTPPLVTINCIPHLQSPVVTFVTQWSWHWVCLHIFFWEASPGCNELKMGIFYFEYSYKRTTSMVVVCSWHFLNKLSDLKQTDDNFERSLRRLEKIDMKIHSSQCFYNIGMKKMFYLLKLWRFC